MADQLPTKANRPDYKKKLSIILANTVADGLPGEPPVVAESSATSMNIQSYGPAKSMYAGASDTGNGRINFTIEKANLGDGKGAGTSAVLNGHIDHGHIVIDAAGPNPNWVNLNNATGTKLSPQESAAENAAVQDIKKIGEAIKSQMESTSTPELKKPFQKFKPM